MKKQILIWVCLNVSVIHAQTDTIHFSNDSRAFQRQEQKHSVQTESRGASIDYSQTIFTIESIILAIIAILLAASGVWVFLKRKEYLILKGQLQAEFDTIVLLKNKTKGYVDQLENQINTQIDAIHPSMQAHIYFSQGDYPKAIKLFRIVCRLTPDNFQNYSKLYLSLIETDQSEKVISELKELLLSNPRHLDEIKLFLGMAYKANERFEDALEILVSVKNYTSNPYILNEIGQIYICQQKYQDAETVLRFSNTLFDEPRFYVYGHIALAQHLMGKSNDCRQTVKETIRLIKSQTDIYAANPINANLHAFWGFMRLLENDENNIEGNFTTAIEQGLSKGKRREFLLKLKLFASHCSEENKVRLDSIMNIIQARLYERY